MKKNLLTLILFTAVIFLVLFALLLYALNSNKSASTINTNALNTASIENETNVKKTSAEFELYPSGEETEELQIGGFFRNYDTDELERNEFCTISFPKNYYIKGGIVNTSSKNVKVEGEIADLIEDGKINIEDGILRDFYVGTEGFDEFEPSKEDTVMEVTVYLDAWKEMQKVKDVYEKKVDNITLYGIESERERKMENEIDIYIPFGENYMVLVKVLANPQLEGTEVKDVVDQFADYIKAGTKEKNETRISNTEKEENKESVNNLKENDKNSNSDITVTLNNKKYSLPIDCNELLDAYQLKFSGRISHTLDFEFEDENEPLKKAIFEIKCTEDVDYFDGTTKFENNEKTRLIQVSNLSNIEIPGFEICGINFNSSYDDVKSEMGKITKNTYDSSDNYSSSKGNTILKENGILAYPENDDGSYKIEFEFNDDKISKMSIYLYED